MAITAGDHFEQGPRRTHPIRSSLTLLSVGIVLGAGGMEAARTSGFSFRDVFSQFTSSSSASARVNTTPVAEIRPTAAPLATREEEPARQEQAPRQMSFREAIENGSIRTYPVMYNMYTGAEVRPQEGEVFISDPASNRVKVCDLAGTYCTNAPSELLLSRP